MTETIDNIDVRYHASCGQQRRPELPDLDVEALFKMMNDEVMAKVNTEDYNGGIVGMKLGLMELPLPVPEKGMKWAMRWHDTPSGELLPDLAQVPVGEEISQWREGYPKYE